MCRKLCHLIWGIWWFHRSKDFEAMKAEKLAIRPWLSCPYSENTLMDLPASVAEMYHCSNNAYLDWKNFGNENVLECNCQIKFLSNNVGFLSRISRIYYIMAVLVMAFHFLQVLKSKKCILRNVSWIKFFPVNMI